MVPKCLNVHELKARFSYYLKEVQRGRSFIISLRNRPVAELRACSLAVTQGRPLVFGVLKNEFTVPDDFDEPLPEFEEAFYPRR